MKLYNCVEANHPGTYTITKFDNEMNVESSYLVSKGECACPRGHTHSCRHRDMLRRFQQYEHIGDGWFLDWDTRLWHQIAISKTAEEELNEREELTGAERPGASPPVAVETPVEEVQQQGEVSNLPPPCAPVVSHPSAVSSTGAPRLMRRLPK